MKMAVRYDVAINGEVGLMLVLQVYVETKQLLPTHDRQSSI